MDVMNTMMDSSLLLTVGEYLEWGDPNQKPYFDYVMRAISRIRARVGFYAGLRAAAR